MGDESIKILMESLPKGIEILSLQGGFIQIKALIIPLGNNLTSNGCRYIGEWISRSSNLKELDLSCKNIGSFNS